MERGTRGRDGGVEVFFNEKVSGCLDLGIHRSACVTLVMRQVSDAGRVFSGGKERDESKKRDWQGGFVHRFPNRVAVMSTGAL